MTTNGEKLKKNVCEKTIAQLSSACPTVECCLFNVDCWMLHSSKFHFFFLLCPWRSNDVSRKKNKNDVSRKKKRCLQSRSLQIASSFFVIFCKPSPREAKKKIVQRDTRFRPILIRDPIPIVIDNALYPICHWIYEISGQIGVDELNIFPNSKYMGYQIGSCPVFSRFPFSNHDTWKNQLIFGNHNYTKVILANYFVNRPQNFKNWIYKTGFKYI